MTELDDALARIGLERDDLTADQLAAAHRHTTKEPDMTTTEPPADETHPSLERPPQLTRADLKGMAPEAIEAARVAGRLDELLGRT